MNGPILPESESDEFDLDNRFLECDDDLEDACASETGSLACLEFLNYILIEPEYSDSDSDSFEVEKLNYCFYPLEDCAILDEDALAVAPIELEDIGDFVNCEDYCFVIDCQSSESESSSV